jgi:DNA/RNA endonuclease G (NUC1)
MTDLFISYAHKDRDRVSPVVSLLEDAGWLVWWDRDIEPGIEWRQELDRVLIECRAIIVFWSKFSIHSEEVKRESEIGLQQSKLIPILLDSDQIPQDYAKFHFTDLSNWKGLSSSREIEALIRRLVKLVLPSLKERVRPGYNINFLGKNSQIGLPGVASNAVLLRYMHFTVVMNPARRLAHYVAYNVGSPLINDLPRNDNWTADPLIPESQQMNMSLLLRSGYDRGHLMARTTGCWGSKREAIISNRQAFYWPNITPQHPKLNQIWWYALEDLERKIAQEKGKITGFSGPVFLPDDEPFRGEVELEDGLIAYDTFRIPRSFWKVIVTISSKKQLLLAAYLMNQDEMIRKGVTSNIDLKDYLISLDDLEEVTNIRFPKLLHKADIF